MKKDNKTEKGTIYQEIIQNERKAFPNVAAKVIDEVSTLLDSTMSFKEVTKAEITTIAERLIKFQVAEDVSKDQEA